MKQLLILIPTYNEKDNVLPLYLELRRLKLKADILFVDDNSPDGTAEIINKFKKKNSSIHIISRKEKKGIGSAHIDGINWAYKKGYQMLITMDCDFTHKPKDILKFLKNKNNADIIVGSRYLSKNSLSDWNLFRKTLAIIGHFLTKNLLRIPYDATGAFRLYRLDKIPQEVFTLIESQGYSFFFESLFVLNFNKFKIKEVPINLPARTYGTSKMTLFDAWNSLKFLFETFYLSKIYKDSYIYTPAFLKPKKTTEVAEDEWDEYWMSQRKKRKILYDVVAVFYRKYIIRRTLNHFIKKTFKKNEKLLHAGCGGGQVDSDIVTFEKVTALDISTGALNRYKALYKDSCEVMHGSILKIPVRKEQFDGIYNLGVMEHFTKKDIRIILDEFHRVLKKNGKIVLFWPPQFGMSVIFLNTMHFILNNILKKNVRLHPEEITKVTSRKQIENILKKSKFELTGFHFGIRDAFTYTVIIGQKLD